MPTITEPENKGKARFEFTFPEELWLAFKYDEKTPNQSSFYQERLEKLQGVKGVDIVAIDRPNFSVLTLIEVKDFRDSTPGSSLVEPDGVPDARNSAKTLRAKLESGEIPREIYQKALNTWAGLHLGARAGETLLAPELRAAVLAPTLRLDLIFFLAQDPLVLSPRDKDARLKEETRRKQRQGLEKQMRARLQPLGIHCRLADADHLPRRCTWTVRALPPMHDGPELLG